MSGGAKQNILHSVGFTIIITQSSASLSTPNFSSASIIPGVDNSSYFFAASGIETRSAIIYLCFSCPAFTGIDNNNTICSHHHRWMLQKHLSIHHRKQCHQEGCLKSVQRHRGLLHPLQSGIVGHREGGLSLLNE